jgi:hypothetical protein
MSSTDFYSLFRYLSTIPIGFGVAPHDTANVYDCSSRSSPGNFWDPQVKDEIAWALDVCSLSMFPLMLWMSKCREIPGRSHLCGCCGAMQGEAYPSFLPAAAELQSRGEPSMLMTVRWSHLHW